MNRDTSNQGTPSDDTGMTEEEQQRLREEGGASQEETMSTDEY